MHSNTVSTAVVPVSRFEVGLIVRSQPCCDETRQLSQGPTMMVWCPRAHLAPPPSPPTIQFNPLALQTIINVYTLLAGWSDSGQIFSRSMKEILKLKPLLSIRVGFLQLRRSIYIKRVKSVARNESELNAEFGACNHFYKSRT